MNSKYFKNSKNFYKRISTQVVWQREGLCNRGYTFVNGKRQQVAEFLYDMVDHVSGWAYAEPHVVLQVKQPAAME